MWKSSTARNVAAPFCLVQCLPLVDRGKPPGEPARAKLTAHGVESDCNERAPDLFNGHCGCRQRFGRSILSIGTSTRHSGHLTVFVSSISMRMADAKEKAYWGQPATGPKGCRPKATTCSAKPTPTVVPMGGWIRAAEPKGRFRKLQKSCEWSWPKRATIWPELPRQSHTVLRS